MITQAEIETCHHDGYVIPRGIRLTEDELEPGKVPFHDIGTIHGSAANTPTRRRAGLALRYMPATSCMYRKMENAAADRTEMPMERVRGEIRRQGNHHHQRWHPWTTSVRNTIRSYRFGKDNECRSPLAP